MTKTLFKWKYSNTPKHRSRINYELLYDKNKWKQYKTEKEKQQIIPKKYPAKMEQYSYSNNNGSRKHTWNKTKAKT